MCGLTTEWNLESAQSLACALTITWILEERSMPWSGEILIPRSERELRCSEGSGKLIDDSLWWREQCWLDQQGEWPITELWGVEKLGRSEGSGMLIGDPLVEGSSASSTDGELWRAENSFLRMRGNSDARKGAACSWVTLKVRGAMLARPTRRATYHRALGSGELTPQSERELRRPEGSGMLIGDPLWWGEQC